MKYWAYVNNEILGPYEKDKLLELPAFSATTLLCPQTPVGEKTEEWKEASAYPEVAALLNPSGAPAPAGPAAAESAPAQAAQPETGQKLKPLSFHQLDPAPPAARSIDSPELKVNQLGATNRAHEKELPSFTSASFDPLSLSQINKRAESPHPDVQKTAPQEFTLQEPPPQTSEHRDNGAPAVTPPFDEVKTPAAGPETAPLSAGPSGAPPSLEAIYARLDALARTSVTRQDIEPLREKLEKAGGDFDAFMRTTWPQFYEQAAQSDARTAQGQSELLNKIQFLEKSVSELKAALAQPRAQLPTQTPAQTPVPKVAGLQGNADGIMSPTMAPAEPRQPQSPKTEPRPQVVVDKGSSTARFTLRGVVKKSFRFIMTLVLLALTPVVAVFFFRQAGLDITSYLPMDKIPFKIPFLPAPEAAQPAAPAPQPFQQAGSGEEAGAGTTTQTGQAAQGTPAAPDYSPEIIYLARTFSLKPGGNTLENQIYRDAEDRKGDFNKTSWQVSELREGVFKLTGVIPLRTGSGQLVYNYEVDRVRKTVVPMDETSKVPMFKLIREADQANKAQLPKGRKGRAAVTGGTRTKPAAKPARPKTAVPEDEYEYVEEDEGGTEE